MFTLLPWSNPCNHDLSHARLHVLSFNYISLTGPLNTSSATLIFTKLSCWIYQDVLKISLKKAIIKKYSEFGQTLGRTFQHPHFIISAINIFFLLLCSFSLYITMVLNWWIDTSKWKCFHLWEIVLYWYVLECISVTRLIL